MHSHSHAHEAAEVVDAAQLQAARRVTWLGFGVNAVLAAAKILAGVFGRSSAMVADGVHSLSDFATDVIVLVFVGLSHRKADAEHQYGHGKYETLATLLIAVLLGWVAVMFAVDGVKNIIEAIDGHQPPRPTWLALGMALGSIGAKELLYRYTRHVGERIHSAVVIANAWHHRSDALSSLATLAGIAGAMFLGPDWRVLDPIAAVAVAVFIMIVAVQIGRPALSELLERSLPAEVTDGMARIIGTTPGVRAWHHFASRRNGNMMIVDFHIKVDGDITVRQAHAIADDVEARLRQAYGRQLRINTHIEPYDGRPVDANCQCK